MGSNSHLCNLCCSRIPDQVQQEVCIYWGSYLDNALTNNHCLHYKALRSFFLLWQTLFKGLPAPFGSHRPDVQSLLWLHLSPSPSFLLHVGCPSPFARPVTPVRGTQINSMFATPTMRSICKATHWDWKFTRVTNLLHNIIITCP